MLTAVRDLSLSLSEGETFGIVGETGCGKSVTALSILRLVPTPPARIVQGELIFEGEDLLRKSRARHGKDPRTQNLHDLPGTDDIAQSVADGRHADRRMLPRSTWAIRKRSPGTLPNMSCSWCGLPSPHTLADRYPHELSGGMRQRVMIAMALACEPRLLIADEPTTALDVTIQAQIIELLKELQEKLKMALIFISHNLGVVARLCDRIGVMYAGSMVEQAEKKVLFTRPQHPYTIALLEAIPRPGAAR